MKVIRNPRMTVVIDDTTLREGEQTPGVVFDIQDKDCPRIVDTIDIITPTESVS